MRFSKEARIGLLTASAIVILFAGFYFLKGVNVFSGENKFYAYYDDVQGLQMSSPVQIKGYTVGRVASIELNGQGQVKVKLAISKKTKIPAGTIAKLTSIDLLGTKAVALELKDTTALAESEDVLPSAVEGGIIDAISIEITPLIADIRTAVGTLDSVLLSINTVLDSTTKENLHRSIASLDVTMDNFAQLSSRLNAESGELSSVIRNANSITGNLAKNNDRITRILDNIDITSGQLSRAPVEQTFKELQQASAQLQGIINKINNKEGSLGLLVGDKGLYNNLNESLQTLNSLMADIEAHPARYINLTIFGRKKQ